MKTGEPATPHPSSPGAEKAAELAYADGSARSPEAQALLDRAQEVRAIKRPQDPEWPVLTFVEAMDAAASMLDKDAPTTADRVRRGVNYLLHVAARAGEIAHEETKQQILANVRAALRPASEPREVVAWLVEDRHGRPFGRPYLDKSEAVGYVEYCPGYSVRALVYATPSPAARETETVEPWRPIATAPKDGTKVLIFAQGEVFAARWDPEFTNHWDDERDDLVYDGAWTDGAVRSFGYEECMSYEPTHWQPLPAAPSEPPGSEEGV